ncbi:MULTISPECIES: HAMP domain-containing sensor histidine kinase [unclassified Massilia]|uniref:sensor histidine kinase n=1 Tax=unclassified Massilia TaxID=2609279 RepID=UPI0009E9A2FF|nr:MULTISPECIES: HAMP domain-containing sensor histidine kinase [unclassified Massilia]
MMLSTNQQSSTKDLSEQSRKVLSIRDEVFAEWEKRVRSLIPGADEVSHPVLLDTLPLFYGNIAEALSPGFDRENAASDSTAATGHGSERARTTEYKAVEIVYEYQLLRDALLHVAGRHGIRFTAEEAGIIGSSFDQAIRDAIEEFTALQRAFRQRVAASLTHDMRSPLSVIVSGAELLLATDPGKSTKILQKILENGLRLEQMIQEQLDAISKPAAQSPPLAMVSLDALQLAREVAEHVNDTTPAHCEAGGESVVGWWDESALRRALENLASNAAKYGDGQQVRLNVAQTHGRVILSVHNCGNPIPDEQRKNIFEYLNRGQHTDKIGWGIGLPFVQEVAKRHGGTVVLDSSAQSGTTFTIDIPIDGRAFNPPS